MSESLSSVAATVLLFGGVLLMVIEAIVPGAYFIILGLAAFTTGVIGVLTPVGSSFVYLIIVFLIMSILTYLLYSRFEFYRGDGGAVGSKDSADLVGVKGIVIEEVTETSGLVKLNKIGFTSNYEARSQTGSISTGSQIVVTDGRGGSVVTVKEVTVEK